MHAEPETKAPDAGSRTFGGTIRAEREHTQSWQGKKGRRA